MNLIILKYYQGSFKSEDTLNRFNSRRFKSDPYTRPQKHFSTTNVRLNLCLKKYLKVKLDNFIIN